MPREQIKKGKKKYKIVNLVFYFFITKKKKKSYFGQKYPYFYGKNNIFFLKHICK